MEGIIIIAIIVGIIGMLTKKSRLEKPNGSKQVPSPLSLFGNPPKKIQNAEQIKEFLPSSITKAENGADHHDNVYRDERLNFELQTDRLKIQEEYNHIKHKILQEQMVQMHETNAPLEIIDRDEFVKGIILAEILGPPRSKKHYRR